MFLEFPITQSNKIMALLMTLSQVFPDAVQDLLQLTRSAKHGITVEIKPLTFNRTREQEKYYRKYCKHFADWCGYPPDEMHDELLCICFGSDMVANPISGGYTKVPHKRSADAHRVNYSELIETLIRVASRLGFVVPPPTKVRSSQ